MFCFASLISNIHSVPFFDREGSAMKVARRLCPEFAQTHSENIHAEVGICMGGNVGVFVILIEGRVFRLVFEPEC